MTIDAAILALLRAGKFDEGVAPNDGNTYEKES
jgi:hypothetical protein